MIRCRWCKNPLYQRGNYAICETCDLLPADETPPKKPWWSRKKKT